MIYSKKEVKFLIELRKRGYIGQRLCSEFNKKFSCERECLSIRNKIYNLRERKVILR